MSAEIEKGTHFDILFLDVIMPGQNGINVAREIRQNDQTHTLVFHLESGINLESIGSLDELSSELAQYGSFLRPHRSFLINMEYIQSISYKAITLDNMEKIPIPHGKCPEIKNLYLDYAFNRKQAYIL